LAQSENILLAADRVDLASALLATVLDGDCLGGALDLFDLEDAVVIASGAGCKCLCHNFVNLVDKFVGVLPSMCQILQGVMHLSIYLSFIFNRRKKARI